MIEKVPAKRGDGDGGGGGVQEYSAAAQFLKFNFRLS